MTKAFSNSSTKINKLGIFDPKFKDFCFCIKLCYKTNYRVLITKMKIDFQCCSPKHTNKAFLVRNIRILIFCMKLCNQRNWGALITNMTIAFENSSPKTQQGIFSPKFFCFFLVLDETLQFYKFEYTNQKLDNSFYQIVAQKYLSNVFLFISLIFCGFG